jgi:uncharacterized protein YjiS (DUF1127 family)
MTPTTVQALRGAPCGQPTTHGRPSPLTLADRWDGARAIVRPLRDRIQVWVRRARSRSQLRQHIADGSIMRQDLGVQFGDALREVSKPFWRG